MFQEEDDETTFRSLEALPHLARVLSPLESMRDRGKLAKAVAQWIVDTVAIGCQIHLRDAESIRAVADLGGKKSPDAVLIERVIECGKPAVFTEPQGPVTWVVLPLSGLDSAFGTLSVALSEPADKIHARHMSDLRRVASGLAFAITEAAAHERANQISQALQASLLPTDLAVGSWFDLAARYVPGTADLRIGGDWYDSQIMSDGTVALSVGDVAGHGVEAAAQMGELRSAMAALRLVRSAPDDLIAAVHRLTTELGYFATAVCARLDPTGNLVWASAGHLPPLVVHQDGQSELLETDQSPPLGAGYGRGVPINRYRLNPGDTVLLYTDGLVERRDLPLDQSLQFLVDRISRRAWASTTDLVDEVIRNRDQDDYTGDDIAVLAAAWRDHAGLSRKRAH
ncbi:MAG TPA: PP2C family protein-serine/threonine phosphatase [Acidimicrobiales bacterium]|nr:PP2C family protein-serine/threonine phosphatase [Acidimicrobiales bacterium]